MDFAWLNWDWIAAGVSVVCGGMGLWMLAAHTILWRQCNPLSLRLPDKPPQPGRALVIRSPTTHILVLAMAEYLAARRIPGPCRCVRSDVEGWAASALNLTLGPDPVAVVVVLDDRLDHGASLEEIEDCEIRVNLPSWALPALWLSSPHEWGRLWWSQPRTGT